jgi:hypothetical protein
MHNFTVDLADNEQDKQYMKQVVACTPVRKSAVHFCLPKSPLHQALQGMYALMSTIQERMQSRIHVGSITECLYSLKSFGMPVKKFPSNLKYSRDMLNQWITLRVAFETTILEPRLLECIELPMSKTPPGSGSDSRSYFYVNDVILCPHHEDVLFGKGKPVMHHPGNVTMREMIQACSERYDEAVYSSKSEIAWSIVFHIQRRGGRFLKEHPQYGWFVEVDNDDARQKISIALRDHVKKSKKKKMLVELQQQPSAGGGGNTSRKFSDVYSGSNKDRGPVGADGGREYLDLSDGADIFDNSAKRRKYGACGPSSWFCST